MARMLSAKVTAACRYGCCRMVKQSKRHGGANDPRVRRWTRAADKRGWQKETRNAAQ
jgi:hypothetical protein